MKRGDFDQWIIVAGVNGSGKSTYAKGRVGEFARQGVRCFVQDPNNDFASLGAVYRTADEYRAARGKVPLVASFPTENPDAVLELAKQAAASGDFARPSLFVADEAGLMKGANAWRMSDSFVEAIAHRRWNHCGAMLLVQRPQMVHSACRELATEIVMFRIGSARSAEALQDAGVPESWTDRAMQLGLGQRLVWKKGMAFQSTRTNSVDSGNRGEDFGKKREKRDQ